MIVRVMDDGQFEVDNAVLEELNQLDEEATQALDREDGAELERALTRMAELVRSSGERLADDDLRSSEIVIPPSDLTLEETRKLMSEEGLIPDLSA